MKTTARSQIENRIIIAIGTIVAILLITVVIPILTGMLICVLVGNPDMKAPILGILIVCLFVIRVLVRIGTNSLTAGNSVSNEHPLDIFVRKCESAGLNHHQINESLVNAGWSLIQIHEAYDRIHSV
jgi:hypothetical protein